MEILLKHYVPWETQYVLPFPELDVEPSTKKRKTDSGLRSRKDITLRAVKEMKGHTSYLTFASLLPVYEEIIIAPPPKEDRKDAKPGVAEEEGMEENENEGGDDEERDEGSK